MFHWEALAAGTYIAWIECVPDFKPQRALAETSSYVALIGKFTG